MKKHKHPDHASQIIALKRIEGQIRGIQKMIESRKYCVDILYQTHAVIGALVRVEDNILHKHLVNCVAQAVKGKSVREKNKKLDEIDMLIRRFRKAYR